MLTADEKSAGTKVQMHNATWVITISRDDITLAIAGLGAALGIMNFVRAYWRDRVRLKVIPQLYGAVIGGGNVIWSVPQEEFLSKNLVIHPRLCIEVQNRSHLPTTVTHVGFLRKSDSANFTITEMTFAEGGKLPKKLGEFESLTALIDFTPQELWRDYGEPKCAYADTSTDKRFCGTSAILNYLVKSFREG